MKRYFSLLAIISLFAATATFVPAQKTAVPIVELGVSGLLGGVQNGKWLTPAQMSKKMKERTEFVLVGIKGAEEGGVTFAKKAETEDVCQDFVRMEFELEQKDGIAMGSAAKWNFTPRIPQDISLNNPTYKNAMSAFLKTKGLTNPKVTLTQAYRIDLEGDGVDEVLLVSTNYKGGLDSSPDAGDHSTIVMRKKVGAKVVNFMLEGEFVKKNVEFGAPSEHKIAAIADLNGDGKMEIVTTGMYYEGEFAGAVEMKNGKPAPIKEFGIGCGV